MFNIVNEQAQAVHDDADAYLRGDVSAERVREQDVKQLEMGGHQQTPLKSEKPGRPRASEELLQSTAAGSDDLEPTNGKRQMPHFHIPPKNPFKSETNKRVRFDDDEPEFDHPDQEHQNLPPLDER